MKSVSTASLVFCLAFAGCLCQAEEQNLGAFEYQRSCVQCHGAYGEGDGYLAESFSIAVPDLTSIESRNGGIFPTSDVYQLIVSGSWDGRVHATGEMPVWGPRYAADAAKSYGETSSSSSIAVEKEVHERVAALVAHVYRLQRPAPESMDLAFAVIEKELAEILDIAPDNFEFAAIVPLGYRAISTRAFLLWNKNGRTVRGSGTFDLDMVGIRDLVGGQRQTSFVFSEEDRRYVSRIFGNSELTDALEAALSDEITGPPGDNELQFSFEVSACREPMDEVDSSGFINIHVRDRATNAKFYELELKIAIENFNPAQCE